MGGRDSGRTGSDALNAAVALVAKGRLGPLFEMLVGHAPVGVGVLDTDLRFLLVNEALAERNGRSVEDHVGRSIVEVSPDLAELSAPIFRQVLDTGEPVINWHLEGEAPATPGQHRSWSGSVYRVDLADGEPMGVAVVLAETTEQRRAERRLRRLIDGLYSFVGLLDPDGIVLEANQTALAAVGLERDDVVGRPFWETPWWDKGPEERAQLRAAIASAASGDTVRYDVDITVDAADVLRMDFQLVPIIEGGKVTALVSSGIDITERRREGERSLALTALAQALAVASHTDDVAEAVRTYLGPALSASFANLALVGPDGLEVRLVHAKGIDRAMAARYELLSVDDSTPITDAIRTGEIVLVPNAEATAHRYPHLMADTIAAGLVATASIPLVAEGEVFGAIGLGWPKDLQVDETLEARLRAVATLIAETFLRTRQADAHAALIAELRGVVFPQVRAGEGLDVAVRYQAAGAGIGFGGDWYDVIEIDATTTAIVVGDVVGHGIEAAAKMVGVRSVLNAAVQLRTPLNELFLHAAPAINHLEETFIGTAVILIVDTEADIVHYTAAGHPPVIVHASDGTLRNLDDANGSALGMVPRKHRVGSVAFPPGSRLIAYTDGLVETRLDSIDVGIDRLRHTLARSHDSGDGADQTADRILASAGDVDELTDDIAFVVAVRV